MVVGAEQQGEDRGGHEPFEHRDVRVLGGLGAGRGRTTTWVYRSVCMGRRVRPQPLICRAVQSAPGVIRTRDLPLRRRTLYPLSYGRNGRS
jgi:hypothetical protein